MLPTHDTHLKNAPNAILRYVMVRQKPLLPPKIIEIILMPVISAVLHRCACMQTVTVTIYGAQAPVRAPSS